MSYGKGPDKIPHMGSTQPSRTVYSVYTGQCTVCTQNSVQCVRKTVHSVYTGQCTVCTQDSVHTVHRTVYSVYIGQCTVCT